MSQDNETKVPEQEYVLFGDVTDFDLFKAQVQTLFISLSNEIEKRLKEKDEKIDKIEEQFALLYAGYAEQAAVIESILITNFTDNPEQEKLFRNNLAETRKDFLEMLKQGADHVLAGEDPDTAAAIKNVVDKKLSD
jgi:hypothetical protein